MRRGLRRGHVGQLAAAAAAERPARRGQQDATQAFRRIQLTMREIYFAGVLSLVMLVSVPLLVLPLLLIVMRPPVVRTTAPFFQT